MVDKCLSPRNRYRTRLIKYFFIWFEVFILKELGEYIKEKRKEIGVGLEEAAEDLNLTKDDIE